MWHSCTHLQPVVFRAAPSQPVVFKAAPPKGHMSGHVTNMATRPLATLEDIWPPLDIWSYAGPPRTRHVHIGHIGHISFFSGGPEGRGVGEGGRRRGRKNGGKGKKKCTQRDQYGHIDLWPRPWLRLCVLASETEIWPVCAQYGHPLPRRRLRCTLAWGYRWACFRTCDQYGHMA